MNICDPYSGSPLVAETPTNHISSPWISLKILVVDDDAGVRNVLACILRHADHEVICASDGEEAWEALCSSGYDGMITDHDMPRLSGLDLIRRMRAIPSNLPVVMISGKMPWEEIDFLGLLQPGIALAKPFSCSEVLAEVGRLFVKNACSKPVFERHSEAKRHSTSAAGKIY